MKRAVLVACAVWSTLFLSAGVTSAETHRGSRTYVVQDGLPNGKIQAIAQDRNGYLWLGMSSGLVRFDGYQFVSWGSHNEPPLLDPDIRALLIARDGSLWVGFCNGGGVSRIYQTTVTHFTVRDGLQCVWELAEDRAGTLWAVARSGLARFTGGRWEYLGQEHGLPDFGVQSLLVDRADNLWVGTASGLYRRLGRTDRFERISTTAVRALSEDPTGGIWLIDGARTLRRIGGPVLSLHEFQAITAFGPPLKLLHDRNGDIWIGGVPGRVLIRCPAQAAAKSTASQRRCHEARIDRKALALFKDREGSVWVGTGNALVRMFEQAVNVVNPFSETSEDFVRSIRTAPDGTIVLATSNGLYAVRGSLDRGLTTTSLLSDQDVTAVYVDQSNGVWVSTRNGFGVVDRGRLRPLKNAVADSAFSVARDRRGDLWSCVTYSTMPFILREGQAVAFDKDRAKPCTSLTADRHGRIWIAFADGSVGVHDDKHGYVRYSAGTSPGTVCAIHEDDEGTLWLATSVGLRRWQGGRFVTLTQANGLPSAFLTALVEDNDGFLWIGLKSGVIRLAKSEFAKAAADALYRVRYTHYDASDGVPAPAMCTATPTAVRRADGTLWFVTEGGVAVLDPKRLSRTAPMPVAHIERLVADTDVFTDVGGGLRLPPRPARLRFDYSAPSLSAGAKVSFQFMLEGLDRDWVNANATREAVYTNLRPGAYRFRVRANLEGVRAPATDVSFSVQPSFYETNWFYGGASGIALLALTGVWRMRVRAIHQRFGIILTERARIARELHDTILQSMAGIVLKLEGVAIDAAASTADRLRQVRREIEYHIDEAHQSIWNLRSAALEKGTLRAALQASAADIAGDYPGTVTVLADGVERQYPRDIEEQVLRIAQEAMRNAVKHGSFSHLRVVLSYAADSLRLSVVDDGRGFDAADQEKHATQQWGLRGIRERAARVGGHVRVITSPGQGTRVDTTIPLPA